MSEQTGIAWTDSTWNPWSGCTKVSAGCKHCYAETLTLRQGRAFSTVVRAPKARFESPLHWKRPRLVFTCSMSDFFHEAADGWRPAAWDVIRRTPNLTYQVLTKRPERISANLPPDWGRGWPNVWLGASGETIELAYERGKYLCQVPAVAHFLSAEPWLETGRPKDALDWYRSIQGYDWVIIGGESGQHARPMDLGAARALRDACIDGKIPLFLKQLGGYPDKRDHERAVLDGRTWTDFPLKTKPLEAFA